MLLSKALTCVKFFLYKQKWEFYHGDGYIVVRTIYTPRTDHFTPQQTAFEHLVACLSVVF